FKKVSVFNFLTDEINEQVEEKGIDLVVMGTQGATGAKEVLFGSQTVHTIKKSKCPELAVPSDYEFTPLKSILLPSDLSIGFKENQLKLLRKLALDNKVDLHILHIMTEDGLNAVQEEGKHELSKYFKDVSLHFHFEKADDIQTG